MTLTLHLGVIDMPYSGPAQAPRGRKQKIASGTQTTGDVARILEDKYGVFATYAQLHMADTIGPALVKSVAGSIENLLLGAPSGADPFAQGCSQIEAGFRSFLDTEEMAAAGVPGVPTEAARKGVNHRLKHPYAKDNPQRPSFIDTGLYQASAKAWVD